MIEKLILLIKVTRSRGILRRYFVVNGFDGALAMLGLAAGFRISGEAGVSVMISACFGAAVALGVSGLTSAYLSESAEQKKALQDLEQAMSIDLAHTAHGAAARLIPWIVGCVNGLAPLTIALLVITPLWLERAGVGLPWPPLDTVIALALSVIFLLGAFLGRVSGEFWLKSAIKTLLIALATAAIIFFLHM